MPNVVDICSILFCVNCDCPLICTLLDGLASTCVPVSPILDFVLAYQVTLIEIRKYTERGNGRTKDRNYFVVGNYFEHDGFWPGVVSPLLTKVKTLNTDNVNIVFQQTRLSCPKVKLDRMVTKNLLIDCVFRISY